MMLFGSLAMHRMPSRRKAMFLPQIRQSDVSDVPSALVIHHLPPATASVFMYFPPETIKHYT